MNDVVITGIGLVTPLSPFNSKDVFWDALCSGENGIKRSKPPILDVGKEWLMAGIDLTGINCPSSKEDKFQFIAEEAINMAIKDAKLNIPNESISSNVGLCVGTVLGEVLYKEKKIMESAPLEERNNLYYPASFLADKYGLKGPVVTVSTTCASGTDAIGIASRKIITGKSDIMIAGGVDVLNDLALFGFNILQALTEDKVRPFDKNRSGLALGEGAAFVILESKKHAVGRGINIYGRIIGYASKSDTGHLTRPNQDGSVLARAINDVLQQAEVKSQEIDYINAHGTGTVYNDLMETRAIKKALGNSAYSVPISSVKSMLGHSFGAAGAIESICCLLSMKTSRIPPTINYTEKDSECDLDYVPNKSRNHKIRKSISLSVGFGGQNSAILFDSV